MSERAYKLGLITVWMASSVGFVALHESGAALWAMIVAGAVTVLL